MATGKPKQKVQLNPELSISLENHNKLLSHCTQRLDIGKEYMNPQIDKFEWIDREIAGYLIPDADDAKRESDNKKGFGPKPTDTTVGFIVSQIDEAITFLLSVLAPDEGIYSAIAPKEKQKVAAGFAAVMNRHDKLFGHYPNYAIGLFNAMKYNFTGWIPEWQTVTGNKVTNDDAGLPRVIPNEEIFSGNAHDVIDPYNFLFDNSCHPTELYRKGEWFACVERKTRFQLERMAEQNEIFDIERFIDLDIPVKTYHRIRPEIRADQFEATKTDWFATLSANTITHAAPNKGFEIVHKYIWIKEADFGISTKKEFSIWRIEIVNGNFITAAFPQKNAHGYLPIGIAMPLDDQFFPQTKSYGEWLIPYQRFASFQLNTHQRANRKALGGLTLFNEHFLPGLKEPDVDLAGGKIGFKTTDTQFDVRKAFVQVFDGPDTQYALRDIEAVYQFMQQVLPTDTLRQVANLDRATQYQAAATVQGSNRRNLKIAKIIDSQALSKTRPMMMYNIFEFQESMEILDEQGNIIEVNVKEFRETMLEFQIHAGLRGLDQLALIMHVKEILNMILQNQDAAATFDVPAIINWFTSMLGDNSDFTQFENKNAWDSMSEEQKQAAFDLFQQALQEQQAGQLPGAPA